METGQGDAKPANRAEARQRLISRRRKPNESIADYYEALNKLAINCEFKELSAKEHFDQNLFDAFVNGLNKPVIRKQLLKSGELTALGALELAQRLDAENEDMKFITSELDASGLDPENKDLHKTLKIKNCLELKRKCKSSVQSAEVRQFIKDNFRAIIMTEAFLHASEDEVIEYLREVDPDVHVIWKAVSRWSEFNRKITEGLFNILLQHIKNLPATFTIKYILRNNLVPDHSKSHVFSVLSSDLETLKRAVTIDNCILLNRIVQNHDTKSVDFQKFIGQYIVENFDLIATGEDVENLTEDEIFTLFGFLEGKNVSMYAKWELAKTWVDYDVLNRSEYFGTLLAAIELPTEFLYYLFREDSLVTTVANCQKFVSDVLRQRLDEGNKSVKCETPDKTPKERQDKIIIYQRDSGKILGMQLDSRAGISTLSSTKPSPDDFQGVASLDDDLYLLKGRDFKQRSHTQSRPSWTNKKELDAKPGRDAKVVAFQKHLYIVQNGSFSIYDPESNTWEIRETKDNFGDHFCVCATNEYLFILGGSKTPRRALKYDPGRSFTPQDIERMKYPRVHSAAVAKGMTLCVLGGSDESASNSVELYDPRNGSWVELSRMQIRRWDFCACIYGDKIYVLAGDKPQKKGKNTIEVYDFAEISPEWKTIKKIPKLDTPFTACIAKQ